MVKRLILGSALVLVIVASGAALAQEIDPRLKNLPPALQKAVAAETRGATVKSIAKEKENGKTVYEVETIVGGRTRDLIFGASGDVLVVEEQSSIDAIPAAARATIEKQAAGGRIKSVELLTKSGKTTYEAIVIKGGKTSEVIVNADGTASR
jgi:uncharacterized membrane protein YkoI